MRDLNWLIQMAFRTQYSLNLLVNGVSSWYMVSKECNRRVEYPLIENRNRSLKAKRGTCLNGRSISLQIVMINAWVKLHIINLSIPAIHRLLRGKRGLFALLHRKWPIHLP